MVENKLLELIKVNSTNQEYTLGDALKELFPIDFIKEGYEESIITLCAIDDKSIWKDIQQSIMDALTLLSDNQIEVSTKLTTNCIGSEISIMRLASEPRYVQTTMVIPGWRPDGFSVWDIVRSHFIAK